VKILLVDDDPDLLDVTAYALRREGFDVLVAADGVQALRRWEADRPDLVVLDVGMPHLSGMDVCRKIRQVSETPVIMLTGASDEQRVLDAFENGADDYVRKPFSPKQLALRVRAVLRRLSGASINEGVRNLRLGDTTLDQDSLQVTRNGEVIQLTPLEFRIFAMLAQNEGRVVSFNRLVECGWGYEGGDASMLKTHISHVRKKLKLMPGAPGYIQCVHGVGYILTVTSVAASSIT
jgi:DNA-binding response OmpR family regulator